MRIVVTSDLSDVPGGHHIQAQRTAEALTRRGLQVEKSQDVARFAGADVVHLFGTSLATIRAARRAGALVAVSSIYWPLARIHRLDGSVPRGESLVRRLRTAGGLARSGLVLQHLQASDKLSAHAKGVSLAFESADVLLPNSEGEAADIRRELAVSTPMRVVPNAVDPSLFVVGADSPREGVLYVGRLEPHKNQLGLIEALRGTGLHLTLVGPGHPGHTSYRKDCERAGGAAVTVLEARDQAGLRDLYFRARVHAVPSWYETTGLVSLEAALAGCNVVSTSRGHAREYLGAYAWYCNPADRRTVRAAVLQAYNSPIFPALARRVLERFTWDDAAESTHAAYLEMLEKP